MSWSISPAPPKRTQPSTPAPNPPTVPTLTPLIAKDMRADSLGDTRYRESAARSCTKASEDSLDPTVDPGEILQRLKMLRGERAKGLDNCHEVDNTSPWHVSGLRTKSPGQSSESRNKDHIDRRNLFTPSKESSWGIAEELQGLLSTNPLSKMLLIPDQHAEQSFDIGDRFLQGVNWLRTPNSSSSANTLKPHSNRSRNSILHSPRDVIEQSRELRRSIGSHYNVPQSPRIAIPKSPRIDLLQSFRNSDRTSLNTIPQSPRTTVPQSPRIDLLHSFRNSGRTSLKKNSPSPITTIPQSPRISVRFSQDSETRPSHVGSFGADPINPDPMQTPKSPGRSLTQLLQHLGVNAAQQSAIDEAVNAAVESVKLQTKHELQSLQNEMNEILQVAEEELEREHQRLEEKEEELQSYKTRLFAVRDVFFLRTDHLSTLHLNRCLLLDFMVLWKERDSLTYALVLEWTRFAKMLQQRARHKAQRVHALSLFRRWGGRGLASKAMPDGTELRDFLMKHPGNHSGMFWRDDPRGIEAQQAIKPDWPRNGAVLRGQVHVLDDQVQDNKNWLQVVEFRQTGTDKFIPTPGCWMQFEQDGLLLHKQK